MATVEEVTALQQEIEDLKKQLARTQGVLSQIKKDDLEGMTIEQIKERLVEITRLKTSADEKFKELQDAFHKAYEKQFGPR